MNKRTKKKLAKRGCNKTYKAWEIECEKWIRKYMEDLEKSKRPKTEEEERLDKIWEEMFPNYD